MDDTRGGKGVIKTLMRPDEATVRASERLEAKEVPCPNCGHLRPESEKDVHDRYVDLEAQFEYVTEALVPVISRYFLGLGADAKLIESLATDMSAALVDAGKRFTIGGPERTIDIPRDASTNGNGAA